MAHLNEIIEAKETLEKEMVCLASGENGIFGYEEAVKIAIVVMEDKIEELKSYGW